MEAVIPAVIKTGPASPAASPCAAPSCAKTVPASVSPCSPPACMNLCSATTRVQLEHQQVRITCHQAPAAGHQLASAAAQQVRRAPQQAPWTTCCCCPLAQVHRDERARGAMGLQQAV